MKYGFDERLSFSLGVVRETCEKTIVEMLAGCVSVTKTSPKEDRTGIDYIATLRRGSEVFIDHKARDKGCGKYWNGDAEITIELWSVRPSREVRGVAGWTLDESKKTHYTLHTFHPSDSVRAYLLPFQLLRMAYRNNFAAWNKFPCGIQDSGRWQSECRFVPSMIVLNGIKEAMAVS